MAKVKLKPVCRCGHTATFHDADFCRACSWQDAGKAAYHPFKEGPPSWRA